VRKNKKREAKNKFVTHITLGSSFIIAKGLPRSDKPELAMT